jgi:nucleoside-diphosphate-sugar epimerase
MIRKAVIPAAGMGTRFLPATKAQPKEMLPVVDKPVITKAKMLLKWKPKIELEEGLKRTIEWFKKKEG